MTPKNSYTIIIDYREKVGYKRNMPNRIVHFEIEAKDKDRATKFYEEAFGWEMQRMGPDMGNYVVIVTGDPKEPGGINGGLYQAGEKKEINAYSCVVGVDDIDKAIADIRKAGGKVVEHNMNDEGKDMGEKMD